MNEIQIKVELEQWCLSNARIEGLDGIPYDLDLITSRVVDSLRFIDLILLVEELSGRSIILESIDLEEFKSINAIWKSFFI